EATNLVDFADTLDLQASRTLYVSDTLGGLITIDTSAAELAYAGGGENPFTADCIGAGYDDMYTFVAGVFTSYTATNTGNAVPATYYCNSAADCQIGQDCIDGGCRDTTQACSSTNDCCLNIPGAIDGLDRCLYTCHQGYCTDMAAVPACTGHGTCGAG